MCWKKRCETRWTFQKMFFFQSVNLILYGRSLAGHVSSVNISSKVLEHYQHWLRHPQLEHTQLWLVVCKWAATRFWERQGAARMVNYLGKWSNLTNIFFNWVVQPPTINHTPWTRLFSFLRIELVNHTSYTQLWTSEGMTPGWVWRGRKLCNGCCL